VPFSDTLPTLLELRQCGVKLGVVSNGKPVKQWEKLIRLGLQHFFHTVVISEKDGKPSPKPLLEAASNLGVKPNECLMVGDKESDVVAAKKAGVKCAQLVKHEKDVSGPQGAEPNYLIPDLKSILELLKM
jgi:putative hydrolase of the HAD superfamily